MLAAMTHSSSTPAAPSSLPYRVMLVEDSAVVRGMITRTLTADPMITVVSSSMNGQAALLEVVKNNIEVVLLDIEMPIMDGLTALPLLLKANPQIQVLMVSTLTQKNAEATMKALQLGAKDYIPKPTTSAGLNTDEFKNELIRKIKAIGEAGRHKHPFIPHHSLDAPAKERAPTLPHASGGAIQLRPDRKQKIQAVAIGASTGGTQALLQVVKELSPKLGVPLFVTQHMPPMFTKMLATNLSAHSAIICEEAVDKQSVEPNRLYLAPGNFHMLVEGNRVSPVIRLDQSAPENFCRPAVDPMLRSLIRLYGGELLTVILTGMGSDGKLGCDEVIAAGGMVIAQDQATSVVWGMPAAVAQAGLCTAVLRLEQIAGYLNRRVGGIL